MIIPHLLFLPPNKGSSFHTLTAWQWLLSPIRRAHCSHPCSTQVSCHGKEKAVESIRSCQRRASSLENSDAKLQLKAVFPLPQSLSKPSSWTVTKIFSGKLKIHCTHQTLRKEELLTATKFWRHNWTCSSRAKKDRGWWEAGAWRLEAKAENPSSRTQEGRESDVAEQSRQSCSKMNQAHDFCCYCAMRSVSREGRDWVGEETLIITGCTMWLITTIKNYSTFPAAAAGFSGWEHFISTLKNINSSSTTQPCSGDSRAIPSYKENVS